MDARFHARKFNVFIKLFTQVVKSSHLSSYLEGGLCLNSISNTCDIFEKRIKEDLCPGIMGVFLIKSYKPNR